MDLSKPIVYNSLSINTVTTSTSGYPTSGYLVERFDWVPVGQREYREDRALQDGAQMSDVYLRAQPLNMIVAVFGSSSGDFWDRVQDLRAAFSAPLCYASDTANLGFLPLTFYQPTGDLSTWPTSAYPNGIPLQYYVRATGPLSGSVSRDRSVSLGRGLAERFMVPLVARDPYKYFQSEITTEIAVGSFSTAQVGSAILRGDQLAWPVIGGGATTTTFTIAYGTTTYSAADVNWLVGESLTLDVRQRTLVGSGHSPLSLLGNLTVTGPWEPLSPGTTPIVTTQTSGPSTSNYYVLTRDVWT
jgi:hypothetical protein